MSKDVKRNDVNDIAFIEDLKRQWVAMIDALVDPMMIVNRDYQIEKANRALADLASEDVRNIIGKKCYSIFAKGNSPCEGCKLNTAFETTESTQWSLEHVREGRYYEVTAQPFRDNEGKTEGLVHVYRDRTEAKKLQEQLLQSEKLASIGLLAGGIAHEINNPLGGILVFSQMIHREMSPGDKHYQDIEEILNATERCKAIVENLLEFARQNPEGKRVQKQAIDIVEAAKTALRFGKVGLMSGNINIEENLESEGATVLADRNKMIQLFLNLFQNAFQAMPDGGTLSLRSYRRDTEEGQQVLIEVEDTGVGIPKEHLKRIFDPFFTTKEPGEGTGLGLAICYGIVEDYDGTMEIESEVNEGTMFRITFPTATESKVQDAS